MVEILASINLPWESTSLYQVDERVTPAGDPDTFTVGPGFRESGERAVFRRRADGQVTAMFLAAMTLTRLDPVPADH